MIFKIYYDFKQKNCLILLDTCHLFYWREKKGRRNSVLLVGGEDLIPLKDKGCPTKTFLSILFFCVAFIRFFYLLEPKQNCSFSYLFVCPAERQYHPILCPLDEYLLYFCGCKSGVLLTCGKLISETLLYDGSENIFFSAFFVFLFFFLNSVGLFKENSQGIAVKYLY